MLFWPVVTAVGFLLLTGLVICLGLRSTARYEQELGIDARSQCRDLGHEAEAARPRLDADTLGGGEPSSADVARIGELVDARTAIDAQCNISQRRAPLVGGTAGNDDAAVVDDTETRRVS